MELKSSTREAQKQFLISLSTDLESLHRHQEGIVSPAAIPTLLRFNNIFSFRNDYLFIWHSSYYSRSHDSMFAHLS